MHSNKSICLKVLKEQTNTLETIHACTCIYNVHMDSVPYNMTPV